MLSMLQSWEIIFLFFATMLAFFIKAITGFGNTLVMGSLFSFVVPNTVTTPVDLLMSVPTNGWMAWRERRAIVFKSAVPLAILMVLGLIPGAFFLRMGDDRLLRALMGLVIVGMALQIALKREDLQEKKQHPLKLIFIGLLSGVLAGIFGIGALVAIYFSRSSKSKQEFRSNTCFVFFVENVFRIVLYLGMGILNRGIFLLTAALLPAVVLGMVLGRRVDKFVDEQRMKWAVVVLLVLSGSALFVRNLFFASVL